MTSCCRTRAVYRTCPDVATFPVRSPRADIALTPRRLTTAARLRGVRLRQARSSRPHPAEPPQSGALRAMLIGSDDQAPPAHRPADLPRAPRGGLLLRRQDRLHRAAAGRGQALYFLSRPRRFGKSLFLDTLMELFEGSEPLFAGLHIHDRWDWSVRNPVVRLDFGAVHFGEPGYVHANAMAQLAAAAEDAGVVARYDTAPERFRDLLPPCTLGPVNASWCWWTSTTTDSRHPRRTRHRPRQPQLPAGSVLDDQVQRRPRSLHLPHGRQPEPSAGEREGAPLA